MCEGSAAQAAPSHSQEAAHPHSPCPASALHRVRLDVLLKASLNGAEGTVQGSMNSAGRFPAKPISEWDTAQSKHSSMHALSSYPHTSLLPDCRSPCGCGRAP